MTTLRTNFTPRCDAAGKFSGYASVFGNVDSHGDVVQRGAFQRSLDEWRDRGRAPHLLLQHGYAANADTPVGQWTMLREDAKGLYVQGQLLCLDTDIGRQLLGLMRGGVLFGLSIGFRVRKYTPGTTNVKRILTEVSLAEISLVTEPSNPETFLDGLSPADAAADRLRAALAAAADTTKSTTPTSTETAADKLRAALQTLRN